MGMVLQNRPYFRDWLTLILSPASSLGRISRVLQSDGGGGASKGPLFVNTMEDKALATTTPTIHSTASANYPRGASTMTEPLPTHPSPDKRDASAEPDMMDDGDFDMTFQEPPSSPFMEHVEHDDQENRAPRDAQTPVKPLLELAGEVPQSAFRVSPEKRFGLQERTSPAKLSPAKNLMDDFEEAALAEGSGSRSVRSSPRKPVPIKLFAMDDDFDLDLGVDTTDYSADGPELSAVDNDDSCFSNFSEMPGLDMTKFASLKQSPAKGEQPDVRSRRRTATCI